MLRDDSVYLLYIRDAIEKIQEYTRETSRQTFLSNTQLQDAVIRQIEIIGEASKRISEKTRTSVPEIPWQDIAGMREERRPSAVWRRIHVNPCADYTDEHGYARRRNFLSPNPEVSRIGISKTLIRANPRSSAKIPRSDKRARIHPRGSLLQSLI